MNSPAIDVANILAAAPVEAGVVGASMFLSTIPSSPDNCIGFFDTGGFEPAVRYFLDRPTIMIKCRNKDYNTGWNVLQAIKNYLHGNANITVNDTRYIQFLASSDIAFLEVDSNKRFLFSINFAIQRTTAPLTYEDGSAVTFEDGSKVFGGVQ